MLNLNVVYSVLRRNVQSYFSGVLGYLVIVLFVTVAAFCAFSPEFFANNLANLDQLSQVFPLLLLAIVPAITMSTWAEEKKLGTDEILFTLPASDVEILLGKYLAALTVYTIALAFSLTQLFVLAWIGNPDWGIVFTTYVGYWLAGAALLSAGLFASSMTGSTTVAYVLGACLCAIPVFIGELAPGSTFLQGLSLSSQLRDFESGMISLNGLLYFVTLTVFMLYLNMVVITRRHWARGETTVMILQFAVRAVFLAVALVSINFMAEKSAAYFVSRVDMTSENLYTLSPTTKSVLETAKEESRLVTIRAFISPEVPQRFVYARKQLVGLLRQYDRIGGNTIEVVFEDVGRKKAIEARTLGVEPVRDRSDVGGKEVEQDVFLGVLITSNVGEVVLPFLDGESSMEYELTRAIATVTSRPERLKVGILETDGLRLSAPPRAPAIRQFFTNIIAELELQYKVTEVTRDRLAEMVKVPASDGEDDNEQEKSSTKEQEDEKQEKKVDKPDVLIVVQPSSLTQAAMTDLIAYIEQGNPVLLFDDPLPFYPYVYFRPEDLGVVNAPKQDRPSPDSGLSWVTNVDRLPVPPEVQQELMRMQQQLGQMPPQFARQMMENFYQRRPEARPNFEPKADNGTAASLLKAIGLEWNNGRIAWDSFNPHPEFTPEWSRELFGNDWPRSYGRLENTFLFVTRNNGAKSAFNPDDPISAGLQELLFVYPGTVRESGDSKLNYRPLAMTGPESGLIPWDELTYEEIVAQESFDQFSGERKSVREPRNSLLTNRPLVRLEPRPKQFPDDDTHVLAAHVTSDEKNDKSGINVVFVADIDFLSDYSFQQQDELDKPLDNVTFVFNAIEVLAADDSLVTLRNRRAQPRRLVKIQGQVDSFRRQRAKAQQEFEQEIAEELGEAQKELNKKTEEISQGSDLDIFRVGQKLHDAAQSAQRKFEAKEKKLNETLQNKISELKATESEQIDTLELKVRCLAVLLPPFPALLLGIGVLLFRVVNESKQVTVSRRHM